MKRILIALVALAVAAMPAFAADEAPPDMKGNPRKMMHHAPELRKDMMDSPQHMMAMAYHQNLVTFGRALEKVAQQGETVPPDFARAAIAEMRRSAEQMEKYHGAFLGSMPADMAGKQGDREKMMAAHLAEVKTHLGHLEELAKSDRIDSKEALKHLELLFKECKGMPGRGMHGKGMHGEGEECQQMMQKRHKMMDRMKAQDAELATLVDRMNHAPKDKKQALMADILTRIVKQRAEMAAHMGEMQEHVKHHRHGASMAPCPIEGMDGDDDTGMDDADTPAQD